MRTLLCQIGCADEVLAANKVIAIGGKFSSIAGVIAVVKRCPATPRHTPYIMTNKSIKSVCEARTTGWDNLNTQGLIGRHIHCLQLSKIPVIAVRASGPLDVIMYSYVLLALVPAVLACTNPDTDPCASFMTAQAATASPFCATFTQSSVTATTGLPSWASNCSNKPSAISKECTWSVS